MAVASLDQLIERHVGREARRDEVEGAAVDTRGVGVEQILDRAPIEEQLDGRVVVRGRIDTELAGTGWEPLLAYAPRHRLERRGFELAFDFLDKGLGPKSFYDDYERARRFYRQRGFAEEARGCLGRAGLAAAERDDFVVLRRVERE